MDQSDQNDMYKGMKMKQVQLFSQVMQVLGTLPKNAVPTIGIEFAGKSITLTNGKTVKAQIWDTAGQERYRAITSNHFRRAIGALVVYDVTKESSFESVVKWMEDLRYQAEPDIIIILVGNKTDLTESNQAARKVQKEDGKNLATQHKVLFEETSAVTGHNVTNCFETLMKSIYNLKNPDGKQPTPGMDGGQSLQNQQQPSSCPC